MADELSITQKATGWPAQMKDYFEELQLEMRRVTWPTWKQVRGTTAVVIASVFMFAAYFFVVDTISGRLINKLFDIFTK